MLFFRIVLFKTMQKIDDYVNCLIPIISQIKRRSVACHFQEECCTLAALQVVPLQHELCASITKCIIADMNMLCAYL